LCIRQSAHVRTKLASGVDQCGERRQIARAGVQPQQVKPNTFQRRNSCRQLCRRYTAAPLERLGSVGTLWRKRRDQIDFRARGRSLGLERRNDRRQFLQPLAVRTGQRRKQLARGHAKRRFRRAEDTPT